MADNGTATGLPIVCTDAVVVRGGVTLLSGVDLSIMPGARTVVLGANGSGKSTLLRLLHGLAPPSLGRSPGLDRPRASATAASDGIPARGGCLRRSACRQSSATLLDDWRASTAIDAPGARIDDALAEVGLRTLATRAARVLSGGEQQRLALARAWALRPEVLFLDEPTASLDPRAARAVEDIVRGIHAQGTTIVMTTHNLAQAKRLADDVVYLQEGRVVEQSPADIFFDAPHTAEAAAFLEGERL